MSRIYEALREAERIRSNNRVAAEDGLGVMEMPDRRCSERWELEIDLTVYGHVAGEPPFYERARALKGNENGGLILLSVPVCEGQDLLLINNRTSQEQICRIVNVHIRDLETSEASVAFPSPHPEFWEIPDNRSDISEMYLDESI
jgi:hypothetical protein